MAIVLQGFCRIVQAKKIYYLKKGLSIYLIAFQTAAIQIQKVMRRVLAAKRYKLRYDAYLFQHIDVPAAVRIQRILRGRKGRKVAARKKLELERCIRIQLFVKKFVRRVWALQVPLRFSFC